MQLSETQKENAPGSSGRSDGLRFASAFAFVGSGCLLVIELVAGRLLAPAIGVSLYTWTSIIGVVLAGISLGNYVGGRIADKRPGRGTLSTLYFFSALSSGAILIFARNFHAVSAPHTFPAIVQVLWLTTIVFFVPSAFLGTITPMLVKLSLASLEATGRVVGRIQAAATLGSIVGTFATGFFLISWFGTRAIVAGVALILLLLGILSTPLWKRRTVMDVAVIAALIGGMIAVSQSSCTRESNYYCIKVAAGPTKNIRVLSLDYLIHGYVDLNDPTHLLYPYEQLYAELLSKVEPRDATLNSLLLGGGAYTFPRYLLRHYQGTSLVAEIDPAVTAVARKLLALRSDPRMTIMHQDARRVIEDLPADRRFDVVLGDTFNDAAVPYHLTTLEFDRMIAAHLTPNGIYMVNVVDAARYDFLRAFMTTLRQVFPHVDLMTPPNRWPAIGLRQTFVVVATMSPLSRVESMVPADSLASFLRSRPTTLLTDDHAPVDQLLAPVFRQRLESS